MRIPGVPVGSEGGSERWLITYADMLTLLFVLFVVLYSMANTDLEKFRALAESLSEGFGATVPSKMKTEGEPAGTKEGSSPIHDTSGGGTTPVELFPEQQTPIQIFAFAEMLVGTGEEAGLMAVLQELVEEAIIEAGAEGELEGLGAKVTVAFNERGIVISIFPDQILFDSGSARIKPGFRAILDVLAEQFALLPNRIEVQGHTDNVPIATATYPSNWELSAGRAGSVIRHFAARGVPPERLAAAGYADTIPVAGNDTREGRSKNRRVVIVILRGDRGITLPTPQVSGSQAIVQD